MIIAVTHENSAVFQHFGHTKEFMIYEVNDGKIEKSTLINTMGTGHGALAGLLRALRVNVLICGGIGMGARNALAEAKIEILGGVSGSCDKAVEEYLSGTLSFDPDAKCTDHHASHEDGHSCGSHSCEGSENCGNHGCHG